MVDRYTKVVLTVIAGSLCAIAVKQAVLPAFAQMVGYNDACGTATHPVCQVEWSRPMPVRIVQ